MNNNLLKKIIVIFFISVPILSSVISTLHLIDLFTLGNPSWLAVALAIAIEIGSVASFLNISILSKLNKSIVLSVFVILFLMQIGGNMYFSYEWITEKMIEDPRWIESFKQMSEFFLGELQILDVKMYLTILISWPIPLISVFLLKSATDYLGTDKVEVENVKEPDQAPKEISFYDLKAQDRDLFRKKFSSESTESSESSEPIEIIEEQNNS
jgi:hypothetical protein